MDSLSAIQIRRAEEQMATAWREAPQEEAREERTTVAHTCEVPGCTAEVVYRRPHAKAYICTACVAKGLIPSPCPKCGGPRRRMDQKHSGRGERSGLCQTCRLAMPQNQNGWKVGTSGNPAGKSRSLRACPGIA